MTIDSLRYKINKEMLDLANDINHYLNNTNVPLECYPEDINIKIEFTKNRIDQMIVKFKIEQLNNTSDDK